MAKGITRRGTLQGFAAAGALTATSIALPSILRAQQEPVKLGFLTALTGLETILGETQLNCFTLAVEEINAAGGIAGRPVEFVVEDDQTTTKGAIEKARKLIAQDKVSAIIGLIASLEHVAARSVTTPSNIPLIYTTYYEGEVCEAPFFATGQVPNQQIDPLVEWLSRNVGKSIYILGSDYIWPRRSTEAIKAAAEANGVQVLGAEFFPFGTQDFGPAFDRVKDADPDMVWLMVAGSDSITALKQYRSFGMKPQLVAQGSDEVFGFAHPELNEGIISNQAYFMTLDTPENKRFVSAYEARFGAGKPINAIGEAAYVAVNLYKLAVEKVGTTEPEQVIPALREVEFSAPQGRVNFADNNHLRCNSLLGRGRSDGRFDIIENYGQIDPLIPGCSL